MKSETNLCEYNASISSIRADSESVDYYLGRPPEMTGIVPSVPRFPPVSNLTVYPYTDGLHGQEPVLPKYGELGGEKQYSTVRVVPFWTRWPILFPLEEEINSILPKPLE
jgi:hypothetical protein